MPRANWFLALVVPEQAGLSQQLRDLPPGQRPFQAADLHITVAFLGACDRTRAWQAWLGTWRSLMSAVTIHRNFRACGSSSTRTFW